MKLFINLPFLGKTELPIKGKTRREIIQKYKSNMLEYEGYTFSVYDIYAQAEDASTGGGAILGGVIGLSGGTAGAIIGSFLGGVVGNQIENKAVMDFNQS